MDVLTVRTQNGKNQVKVRRIWTYLFFCSSSFHPYPPPLSGRKQFGICQYFFGRNIHLCHELAVDLFFYHVCPSTAFLSQLKEDFLDLLTHFAFLFLPFRKEKATGKKKDATLIPLFFYLPYFQLENTGCSLHLPSAISLLLDRRAEEGQSFPSRS